MKKLIVTTMALALMAAPAFADGTISGGSSNTSLGLLAGQTGTNGNAINEIRISGATGNIRNNGDHSVNFGSLNTGSLGNITNISGSYVEAPEGLGTTPGTPNGDVSLTTVSSAAVGATTHFEAGFRPEFATLGVDYNERTDVNLEAIVVVIDRDPVLWRLAD
jgi:hypothetical protein